MTRIRPRTNGLLSLFPHGPLDVVRQVLLFYACYHGYSIVRGLADNPGSAQTAFENARGVISVERTLHIFVEPAVQSWVMGSSAVMDAAAWIYMNAQTTVTVGALVYIYLRRNRSFYFVRNMMVTAMCLALVGYVLYPTAPPRFFPEWGFFDSVSSVAGVETDNTQVDTLFNPYAAIPSMHVAFSLMIGWSLARLVEPRALKVAWGLYPLLVTFVIVATANHFLIDAIAGATVAALSALAARELGMLRPMAWRFGPRAAIT